MKKAILPIILLFMLIFLASAVSAYTVNINWKTNQNQFDVEVYHCTDNLCENVDNLVISDTSYDDEYRTTWSTSGDQYHAVYLYADGYRVNNYIVHTNGNFKTSFSADFVKKDFCEAPIVDIDRIPFVEPVEGMDFTYEVYVLSAFETPSPGSNMPIYAPSTHPEFFESEVEVEFIAMNGANLLLNETHTLNIFESDFEGTSFNLNNIPSGNVSVSISTRVIDNICESTNIVLSNFSETLEVNETPNNAPVITTSPVNSAYTDELYVYDVDATDADGDTLTYSLITNPAGMTINPSTGLIQWTPSSIGDYNVQVLVTDGTDSDNQLFTIHVTDDSNDNNAPVITTSPITSGQSGQLYVYDVNATDADGDTLTYSLINGFPAGMTINPSTGLIQWTPTVAQSITMHNITVHVSDGTDSAIQAFTIDLTGGNENHAPIVNITSPESGDSFQEDDEIEFRAIATDEEDGLLVVSWASSIDGFIGTGNVDTTLSEGTHIITASATDSENETTQKSIVITINDDDDDDDDDDSYGGRFIGTFNNINGLLSNFRYATMDSSTIVLGKTTDSNLLFKNLGWLNWLLILLIILILISIFLAILLR